MWTLADLTLEFAGFQRNESQERGPKTSSLFLRIDYHQFERYDPGLAGLFTSEAVARSAIRRQILHWCTRQPGLLPFDLPGSHGEREECPLLPHRRGGSGGGFPALSALPARMFTWNSGLVWDLDHSF